MHIQRQADSFAFRMAAEDFSVPVNDLTSRLRGEFDEWAEPKRAAGEIGPWPRDLVGYWPYVERFLKDKYPVAFQGFDMGQEEAGPGLNRRKNNPYPTGPEAIEQYGYDPKEIAAGMLMLHLGPRDYSKTPKNVLVNIFKTRQKMQRAYDQAHVAIRLAHNTIRCAMPMMYHRTEPEWAKSIYEDKEFGGPNSVWFSDRPTGEGEVYGPAIVQLNIPDEVLKNHGEVEGEFPSGEKHWRVDLDAIKPEYFVDRAIKEARKLLSHNTIRCAADGGQQIYRGLHIDLNHPAAQRLRELVGPGSDLTNSEIGESLIEFLNANSPHPGYQFGPHWTTDFDVASKATGWRDTTAPNPPWPNPGHHSPGYPDQFHVVLKGRHHPGQMESPGFDTLPGTKTTYMWPSEKEITMAAGAPIRLEDIMIHGDTRGTWNSVLNQHRRIHA